MELYIPLTENGKPTTVTPKMSEQMKKVMFFVDFISVIGLLIYNFEMVQGDLRFGREMGDLVYFFALAFGSVIALVLLVLKYLVIIKNGTILTTSPNGVQANFKNHIFY